MGFDSPDLRSPSEIYIRQLEEGLLLAKEKLSHLRRHRLPNDKQKTKKELTRPPCAHSLTSALNYLHGSLPFLARRQTIFSEVPPSPKASISSKKDGAGTLTTLIGRGLGKKSSS
jgi:hypothetical protein